MNNQDIKKIEQNFLSILLNSEAVRLKYVPFVKVEDFSVLQNQLLFQELSKLFATKKHTFDLSLFSHYLASNPRAAKISQSYLEEVSANYFDDGLAENYWNLILQASTKRNLLKELDSLKVFVEQKGEQPDIGEQVIQKLLSISQQERFSKDKFLTIHELMTNFLHNQMHQKKKAIFCSTGFAGLDKLTDGFKPGELIVLAGRPSMGKTALGLNMALNNLNVPADQIEGDTIIFSLEMSDQQIAQRIAMIKSDFANPLELTPEDEANVPAFLQKLEKKNIFINSTPDLDVFKIYAQLLERKKKRMIKLVVIDYLQLLQSSNRSRPETRNLEIGQWTRELKTLAQKLEIPILCISQLSRNVERREEKRPFLSDLRDSGSIEQDADVVMFLYREAYYTNRKKEVGVDISAPHEAEIIISKNRNGEIGTIDVFFNPKKTTFTEIAVDE